MHFEKKYSIPGVLRFRIDDGIYFLLLAIIIAVFCILPSQTDHLLTSAYRQFLIFYGLASILWLITPHCYKHLIYIFFGIIFPLLVLLIYYNVNISINIDNHFRSYLYFDTYLLIFRNS